MYPSTAAAVHSRPTPELEVDRISVLYSRSIRAVHDLSFTVGKGEIVALLGPNGAGKSTTLRALTGFLPGDRAEVASGIVRFRGQSLVGLSPHRTARLGMGLIAERDKIFSTLTVEQNLQIAARVNKSKSDAAQLREFVYALFPVLKARAKQVAGYLSGGERQMLAIASVLLTRPSLLMVDELSLGLAPKVVTELLGVLRHINREQGMSILLVEQSASVAFAIAHHIYLLNVGRVTAQGTPAELKSRENFNLSYLGVQQGAAKQENAA